MTHPYFSVIALKKPDTDDWTSSLAEVFLGVYSEWKARASLSLLPVHACGNRLLVYLFPCGRLWLVFSTAVHRMWLSARSRAPRLCLRATAANVKKTHRGRLTDKMYFQSFLGREAQNLKKICNSKKKKNPKWTQLVLLWTLTSQDKSICSIFLCLCSNYSADQGRDTVSAVRAVEKKK